MRKLIYIILLLGAMSCSDAGSDADSRLDQAQTLLREDPIGALEKLKAEAGAGFDNSATEARWALLYSEAMAANSLTAPDDSVINIAIAYYGRTGQETETARALELKQALGVSTASDRILSDLYLQAIDEVHTSNDSKHRNMWIFIAAAALLVALSAIIINFMNIKLRKARNEALVNAVAGLSKNSHILPSLSRFAGLCDSYYFASSSERKPIIEMIRSQLLSLQNDPTLMAQIIPSLDDSCIATLPKANSKGYAVAVCAAAGFSTSDISLLTGLKAEKVMKLK